MKCIIWIYVSLLTGGEWPSFVCGLPLRSLLVYFVFTNEYIVPHCVHASNKI